MLTQGHDAFGMIAVLMGNKRSLQLRGLNARLLNALQ
jgi:hypothetical protein